MYVISNMFLFQRLSKLVVQLINRNDLRSDFFMHDKLSNHFCFSLK